MGVFITVLIAGSILLVLFANKNKNPSENQNRIIEEKFKKESSIYVKISKDENGEYNSSFDLSFPDSITGIPHLLVVDTETSGLRKYRNKDPENLSNWPRIVQISWLVFDKNGGLIESVTEYFKQPRPIPQDAVDIHGITDEICREKGLDPKIVLTKFCETCSQVEFIVGHNISFDHGVIEANMRRFKVTDDFMMQTKCTMKSSENLLKIPSNFSGKKFKSPNLAELVHFLFYPKGVTSDRNSQHDAEYDTLYTARCYFELKNRGAMD